MCRVGNDDLSRYHPKPKAACPSGPRGRIANPRPSPVIARVTNEGQREAQRFNGASDIAERLASLPADQFDALAPRIAKMDATDAERLLRLMGV